MTKKPTDNPSSLFERLQADVVAGARRAKELIGLTESVAAPVEEKHYFLVPLPTAADSEPDAFSLVRFESIPPGHGRFEGLATRRIFHVSGKAALGHLKSSLANEIHSSDDAESRAGEFLESIVSELDEVIGPVGNGLVIAGTAIALFNPLIGIPLALHGTAALLGGRTVTSSGNSLIKTLRERVSRNSLRKAEREVAKLKVEVFVNPYLAALDAALTNPSHEPGLDGELQNATESFESTDWIRFTLRAVLDSFSSFKRTRLKPNLVALLSQLETINEAWEE